jgi:hypothetical protein
VIELLVALVLLLAGGEARPAGPPCAVPLKAGSEVLVIDPDDLANGTYPIGRPFLPLEHCSDTPDARS